ncbi:DUF1993 domain-containing protein [bacterium (Candidatus Blackallbacteria) CG17_big_fil_post_rev_8_21_14_2_50_48_46]|uniref:DUF1993 domain-containing protein n=1 Tax=bacterium (Candidatus Blackallbacteria) CG17_big_fil_post_rev_8_21_14_2_50_48_46 TaxID=2014261 RepID=A0A2M7FXL9_9BACT|nr:MAG: hypothetical protein COW64_19450 [bacterium (Candidatus Blackallbacteria) CG18_big_fil_WC_8_21_14_2_50_49_26]PIW13832.1 MAG: DUF1993 domain-containing protein [bacterium (Candidatus Blackallbacteria) CG17_big_fil_post_rev_8_21_14_2_50_48_46]PIW45058.1 MAG: DUF1993 domain-containing protein [bacterium (Candidatus Blackallbacteria) CG13_big_fil_rev_8_21_14_2_50_49_14]
MYYETLQIFAKMLLNLSAWLDKLEAYAEERKFDPANLLTARLAPDQFPLIRQIQSSCDSAKFAASRLTGREAPSHPDTETNLAELKSRIQATVDYLRSFDETDFKDSAEKQVVLPFFPDKFLTGQAYLQEFALPNFYFHLNTSYAILRHNGVCIGKQDYIGSLPFQELPA